MNVICPHCRGGLESDSSLAPGDLVICPFCSGQFRMPTVGVPVTINTGRRPPALPHSTPAQPSPLAIASFVLGLVGLLYLAVATMLDVAREGLELAVILGLGIGDRIVAISAVIGVSLAVVSLMQKATRDRNAVFGLALNGAQLGILLGLAIARAMMDAHRLERMLHPSW